MKTIASEVRPASDEGAEQRKVIKVLAGGAVAAVVAVHGWLAMQYGTPAPCQAAVERVTGIGLEYIMTQLA
jgi:hypothetical protein